MCGVSALPAEPAPSRTSGWYQRLASLGDAVLTSYLAHTLTLATLRKHRRQRRGSHAPVDRPLQSPSYTLRSSCRAGTPRGNNQPSFALSLTKVDTIAVWGPQPRPCAWANGATARSQAIDLSWHHCAKSCRTRVLTAQPLPHASSTVRPNVKPTYRGALAEGLGRRIVVTSRWPSRVPTYAVRRSSRHPSPFGQACAAKRRSS